MRTQRLTLTRIGFQGLEVVMVGTCRHLCLRVEQRPSQSSRQLKKDHLARGFQRLKVTTGVDAVQKQAAQVALRPAT
jgi:hypothetical protein